jgi:hypothetical protein
VFHVQNLADYTLWKERSGRVVGGSKEELEEDENET